MSRSIPPQDDTLSLEQERNLLAICERFDQAQRRGEAPSIEEFIRGFTGEERRKILFDLVVIEREWRSEVGRSPSLEDYLRRFPDDPSTIRAVFDGETEQDSSAARPGMERRSRDGRDLLIGFLAFQNGFVDHYAMIEAVRERARDRTLGLCEILRSRGMIDEARMALLDALADEHIKKHGTIEASLAWTDRDGVFDPIFGAVDQSATTLAESSLADRSTRVSSDDRRARDGRSAYRHYSILRHHARGNLGIVYLARDEKLGREVALKRIRPDHAENAESRYRFLLEAEITANLEHPCIVPVYDLGDLSDGRPFYAMRFVRGMTFKGAVKKLHREGGLSNRVELHQLLRKFASVCEAAAYAHGRGIIHRDIKPANIMLGPYGETFIVDFGLAKPLGRHEGEIQPEEGTLRPPSASGSNSNVSQKGYVKGTPAFMSVEQATPESTDKLTPASDIYSLGATLYYLLVGKAPYSGSNLTDVLKDVREGKFKHPRQIDPRVPRSLEAICVKAMSLRPEDRYHSALELARDVERWIADVPVSVYRERFSERLGRWARRNKSVVAALTALCVTAFVVLAWDDWRVAKARDRAEAGFDIARDAVRKLRSDLARGQVAGAPVDFGLRLYFANHAASYLERLLKNNPDDESVRLEAAEVFREKANLLRAFDRGDEADGWYALAIDNYRELRRRSPSDARFAGDLIGTLIDDGENNRRRSRSREASDRFTQAIDAARKALSDDPGNFGFKRLLAQALAYLARTKRESSSADPNLSAEAVALLRPVPGNPDPVVFVEDRLLLGESLRIHAGDLVAVKRFDEAERAYTESIAIGDRFDEWSRTGRFHRTDYSTELMRNEYRALAARSEWELARFLVDRDRAAEAPARLDALVTRLNALRSIRGQEVQAESTLAEAYLLRSSVWATLGETEKARKDLEALSELLDRSRSNLKSGPRGRELIDRLERARRSLDPAKPE